MEKNSLPIFIRIFILIHIYTNLYSGTQQILTQRKGVVDTYLTL